MFKCCRWICACTEGSRGCICKCEMVSTWQGLTYLYLRLFALYVVARCCQVTTVKICSVPSSICPNVMFCRTWGGTCRSGCRWCRTDVSCRGSSRCLQNSNRCTPFFLALSFAHAFDSMHFFFLSWTRCLLDGVVVSRVGPPPTGAAIDQEYPCTRVRRI